MICLCGCSVEPGELPCDVQGCFLAQGGVTEGGDGEAGSVSEANSTRSRSDAPPSSVPSGTIHHTPAADDAGIGEGA